MSKSIRAILAELHDMRESAETAKVKNSMIGGHSCYGVGVEQGIIDACHALEDFINGDDD